MDKTSLPWSTATMSARDLCRTAESLRELLMRLHDLQRKHADNDEAFMREITLDVMRLDDTYEVTK